jgi:tetratricopeptide (TPR) repeat protein
VRAPRFRCSVTWARSTRASTRRTALGYLERARTTSEAAGDRAGVAAALANEGYLHARLGNTEEALAAHEKSLALREALGDREAAAEARMALGMVHAARGDPERALALLRRAVGEAEEIGAQDTLVVSLWATAAARLQAGEPAEAVTAARRAIEEMPAMVGGLSDEHGALVRQRLAPVFETGLRAALALGAPEATAYFLESGRAGALLEALGGRDRLHDVVIPAGLRAEEAGARGAEARALGRYRKALDGNDLAVARGLRAEHETARQGVRLVIERIQREAKAAAHLVYPKASSLAEVTALLGGDEAFVTYAMLADRAVAFVVTKDEARAVPLGGTEEIDKACRDLPPPLARPRPHGGGGGARFVAGCWRSGRASAASWCPRTEPSFVPFCLLLLVGRSPASRRAPRGGSWRPRAGGTGVGVLAVGDPDYETDGAGANQLAG